MGPPRLEAAVPTTVPACDAALSIRTVFSIDPDRRPYDDERGSDGYLRYKWRGTDPRHPENVALRRAMEANLPLIWFQGIETGLHLPVAPVWFVHEEPTRHQFVVAFDEHQRDSWDQTSDAQARASGTPRPQHRGSASKGIAAQFRTSGRAVRGVSPRKLTKGGLLARPHCLFRPRSSLGPVLALRGLLRHPEHGPDHGPTSTLDSC